MSLLLVAIAPLQMKNMAAKGLFGIAPLFADH
jgi:hypothetical protein